MPGEVDAAGVGRGVGDGHDVGDAFVLDDHGQPGPHLSPLGVDQAVRREDDAFAHAAEDTVRPPGGHRPGEPKVARTADLRPCAEGLPGADTRNMVGGPPTLAPRAAATSRAAAVLLALVTVAVLVPAAAAAAPPELSEFPLAEGVSPFGIARGSDGAMWFTERATDSVGRIEPDGTLGPWVELETGADPTAIATGRRRRGVVHRAGHEPDRSHHARRLPLGVLPCRPTAPRSRASRPGPTARCGSPNAALTASGVSTPTAPSGVRAALVAAGPLGITARLRRRAVVHRAPREPHRPHHDRAAT